MSASITGLMPAFARNAGEPEKDSGALIGYSVKYMCIGLSMVATVVALLSEWIVKLLFGGEFAAAALPLQLLTWAQVLNGVDAVLQQAMLARGVVGPAVRNSAIGVAAQLALLILLSRILGLPGAALAVLLSSAMIMAIDLRYLVRNVIAIPVWHFAIAPLIAAFSVACLMLAADHVSFAPRALVAVGSWAVAVALFRVLPRDELSFIWWLFRPRKGNRVKNVQQNESGRVRAIILTTQRSGSTFLVECLRSHPEIECSGEILNGQPDHAVPPFRGPFKQVMKALRIARTGAWMPGRWMDAFYGRGRAKVRCFKAMYNQLSRPFALRYLVENEDVRVIHLRRHNLLKVHVSTLLMNKREKIQATAPTEAVWIHVDPAKAIANMRKAREYYESFDRAFEKHPRLQVSYESLFDGAFLQADTARRICDFLDVAQFRMQSKLTKLNPESLRDMVTNYDELADAISTTEFADMLAMSRAPTQGFWDLRTSPTPGAGEKTVCLIRSAAPTIPGATLPIRSTAIRAAL